MISIENYYSNDEGKTTVVESRNMFRELKMEIFNVPLEEFTRGVIAYNSGKLIQDAFPFLSVAEREFMMTGMTISEQEEFFGNSPHHDKDTDPNIDDENKKEK